MFHKKLILGITCFIIFLSMIPLAGYSLLHFGTICNPNGPCLIPVWFYPLIYAPSGVLFAGLALVFRDLLQRCLGLYISLFAVILGTVISYMYVSPEIAIAGSMAYLISELSDTIVYTCLQRYNLILAIFISSSLGSILDSVIFLHLAFHNYEFILGQIIGKTWMVLIAIILIKLSRKYIAIAK